MSKNYSKYSKRISNREICELAYQDMKIDKSIKYKNRGLIKMNPKRFVREFINSYR